MATKQKAKEKQPQNSKSGLFIPAGLLLGLGCGFVFHNVAGGMFIGLGIGMVVFAILMFVRK